MSLKLCDHLTMKREYYDNCRATCMKCRTVLIVRVLEEKVGTKASKLKGTKFKGTKANLIKTLNKIKKHPGKFVFGKRECDLWVNTLEILTGFRPIEKDEK